MKETSVEWLYERLERMIPRTISYNIDKRQYLQQAKEMEKEQLLNAYLESDKMEGRASLDDAEQYYNETFKPIK